MAKKILFVANTAKKHICHFHLPYMKWFQEHGYVVHVCADDDFEDTDDHVIPYCDCFFPVAFQRSPFHPGNLRAFFQLKKILRDNDYRLIHCHTPVAAALTRIAARRMRQERESVILYTAHGFHFYRGAPKFNKIYYWIEKFLIPYTDGVITINSEDYVAAKRMCESSSCAVWYVPGMGVDTTKIAGATIDRAQLREQFGIPQGAFTLLSVSELNRNKNLKTTISALSRLKDDNIYYLICGSGNMMSYYQSLASKLDIRNHVIFAGYRRDIYKIVHIADIFLFPSIREGLGRAALEAMSAGVPVIASDIRGVREYGINMWNSVLLHPNDVDGYASAIRALKEDADFRRKLGENALNSVAPFDMEKSRTAMEEVYKSYPGIGLGEETIP